MPCINVTYCRCPCDESHMHVPAQVEGETHSIVTCWSFQEETAIARSARRLCSAPDAIARARLKKIKVAGVHFLCFRLLGVFRIAESTAPQDIYTHALRSQLPVRYRVKHDAVIVVSAACCEKPVTIRLMRRAHFISSPRHRTA